MDPAIREGVGSSEVEIRRKSALALADAPAPDALPLLKILVGDPNWRVRKAAVESILSFGAADTLPVLVEALFDPGNAGIRNSAQEALLKIGPEALPTIYENLINDDVDVKLALINLLGDIPSRQNAPYLVYYLNHEDKNLVSASISSLGKLKDPANLRILLDLTHRQDDWLWFHLVEALANIGGPQAQERLGEFYQIPRLRKAVLRALGRMGGREAVPFILDCLSEEGAPVLEAMATLGRLYHATMPDVLLVLHQEEMAEQVREHFPVQHVHYLQEFWAEAKIPERRGMILTAGFLSELSLLDNVLTELDNPYLQGDAFRAVRAYGSSAVRRVIRRLNSCPPQEQRILLIQLLAGCGSEEALIPLMSQAREEDFQVRSEALQALGTLDSPKVLPELVSVLKEPDDTFHEAALSAIGTLTKRRQEFRALVEKPGRDLVSSPSEITRRAGYVLLSEASPQEHGQLLPGLADPSGIVRRTTVVLIARRGGESALDVLEPLLEDPEARVRQAVIASLGRHLLTSRPSVLLKTLADGDVWVRAEAAFFLAQSIDRAHSDRVVEILEGDQLPARIGALRGLAEVGCGPHFDRVLSLARSGSEPLEIRQAAMTSLARSGRPGSADELRDSLRDPHWEIRSTAIHLMGDSGDHRFIIPLLKELERDPDPLVRQSIVEALIALRASEAVPRMLQYLTDPALKDASYKFFISLGRRSIPLIESEAQSVDFQTKMILIDILKQLENM